MRRTALLILLGFLLMIGASCVVTHPRFAPPPLKVEVVPVKPGPAFVWIGGYWRWNGNAYVWTPGHWVKPKPGKTWVPGHWERRGNHWLWRPGRWRYRPPPPQIAYQELLMAAETSAEYFS